MSVLFSERLKNYFHIKVSGANKSNDHFGIGLEVMILSQSERIYRQF